eukprot:scaffold2032_cov112-Isochrysis_galbana.AAC.1
MNVLYYLHRCAGKKQPLEGFEYYHRSPLRVPHRKVGFPIGEGDCPGRALSTRTSHAAGSIASRALKARFPTAIEPRPRSLDDPTGHEDHRAKGASPMPNARKEGA